LVNAVTEAALEASGEAAGRDNETSIETAAGQLLDEKARHARLSCARKVRQQETQWLTRYTSSCATAPVGPLYVSSECSEPYHGLLTTATSWSGRAPLTATVGSRASSPGHLLCLACPFCGNYPCDMLARLKTSLRTLDNHQIKPFIKARIYDRRVRMNRTGGSTTNGLLPVR